MVSASDPASGFLPFWSPGELPGSVRWHKLFPPKVAFGHCIDHNNKNLSRTDGC